MLQHNSQPPISQTRLERTKFHGSMTDLVLFLHATARCAERLLAIVILSVRPPLRLSRPGIDSSPGEIETPDFHRMIT